MKRNLQADSWIGGREAARRLGIDPGSLYAVVAASSIRVRKLPGTWPRYNADDIARVIRESESVAVPIGGSDQAVKSA